MQKKLDLCVFLKIQIYHSRLCKNMRGRSSSDLAVFFQEVQRDQVIDNDDLDDDDDDDDGGGGGGGGAKGLGDCQ